MQEPNRGECFFLFSHMPVVDLCQGPTTSAYSPYLICEEYKAQRAELLKILSTFSQSPSPLVFKLRRSQLIRSSRSAIVKGEKKLGGGRPNTVNTQSA